MRLIDADKLIKTINKQATVNKDVEEAVKLFAQFVVGRFGYIESCCPGSRFSTDQITEIISQELKAYFKWE